MTRVLLSKVTRWNLTSPFPGYSTKSYSAQLQSAWSKPLLQRILLGLVGNISSREKPHPILHQLVLIDTECQTHGGFPECFHLLRVLDVLSVSLFSAFDC